MYAYTKKDIVGAIEALNRRAGFPPGVKLWETVDGKQVSKVGFYHDWYDGGYKLVQTVNSSGGHRSVLKLQAKSKREFYNLIWAYIAGLDDGSTSDVR
jgi:hypothetical protein